VALKLDVPKIFGDIKYKCVDCQWLKCQARFFLIGSFTQKPGYSYPGPAIGGGSFTASPIHHLKNFAV